jgi:hypothetical protein
MSEVASAKGAVFVKTLELWTLLEVSIYTYNVSVGRYVVEVITTPGYAKRVAVTSIWHWLVQDADGPRDDTGAERIGDDTRGEGVVDKPGAERVDDDTGAERVGEDTGAERVDEDTGAERVDDDTGTERLGDNVRAEELGDSPGADDGSKV